MSAGLREKNYRINGPTNRANIPKRDFFRTWDGHGGFLEAAAFQRRPRQLGGNAPTSATGGHIESVTQRPKRRFSACGGRWSAHYHRPGVRERSVQKRRAAGLEMGAGGGALSGNRIGGPREQDGMLTSPTYSLLPTLSVCQTITSSEQSCSSAGGSNVKRSSQRGLHEPPNDLVRCGSLQERTPVALPNGHPGPKRR